MLTYTSPDQLLAEPAAARYLHVILLTSLRDGADWVEVRFGEGEGFLYYRVDGREWELVPPPDDVYPHLLAEVRRAARLVRPERPDVTVSEAGAGEALEIGWLTYRLGELLVDAVVRIDPREPWGHVRLELNSPTELAGPAAEALNGYYELVGDL